jgi:hypothetical protein
MPSLTMIMDGDGCWPDLKVGTDAVINAMGSDAKIAVALLDKGMQSGRTSLRLFALAAKAFAAKYPDLFVGD